MVLERSAQFYEDQIRSIKNSMRLVRASDFSLHDKKMLQKIYGLQLKENRKMLASFSKSQKQ